MEILFQVIQSISLTADIYSCQATVTMAIPKQLRTHLIQSDFKAGMIHNSKPIYIYSLSAGSWSRYYSLEPWGKARTHTPSALEERQTLRIGEVWPLYLSDEISPPSDRAKLMA